MKTLLGSLILLAISWLSYRSWRNTEPDEKDPMFLKTQFYLGFVVIGISGLFLLIRAILELLEVI